MLKKWIGFILLGLIVLLAGCGGTGENWEVEFTKPLQYKKGQETQVEVKITDDGKPVTDVSARALFEMSAMDHGSINLRLEEVGDGLYTAKAEFTMAGSYTVTFTLKKEGYTIEKIMEVEVEKVEGVATINGEPVTVDELDFFRFNNHLQIAVNREADQVNYSGAELKSRMAYWDSQEEQTENENSLLTEVIRLRSMALLAEEKGHHATSEEISSEVERTRTKYKDSAIANTMLIEFGEERFWQLQHTYAQYLVLTQKVQNDIAEKVKQENPNVSDQEISFLAQKEYDELLVSQVSSLDIVIL